MSPPAQTQASRSLALLLSMAMTALLLTGCWDRTEINDLAIILATGIDMNEDHSVRLSAQIYTPRKVSDPMSGTGSESSSSGVTMVQTADGKNIAEAMTRLQRKTSRHVFWGHCEAVVISKDAAKQGIRQYLDFMLRFLQVREHAYVYISEKMAEDIMALVPLLERSSAEALREMGNMKLGANMTILELAQAIEGPAQSVVLSRLLIPAPEPGQSSNSVMPLIKGLALIRNDKYITTVQEPLSIGMLILLNQLENTVFTIPMKQEPGALSIKPLNIRTVLKPHIKDGVWSMQVDISMKGDIILNATDALLLKPYYLKMVETQWEAQMTKLVQQTLQYTQTKLKIDPFGYSVEFRRHHPKEWMRESTNWTEHLSQIQSSIHVSCQIKTIGKSGEPQGIPGQFRSK